MDKNMAWFIRANLKRYKGKYLAIAKGKIVLSGSKPGEIYEKAKARYPKAEVVLWKVPEGEAFAFQISLP